MTGPDLALWAEVDLGRIRRNVRNLKALLGSGTMLLAVVKADAYGHGAVPVAGAAVAGGADWLGVARVHEGEALRSAGVTVPILLLAEPPAASVRTAVEMGLVPTLYSMETARCFAEAAGQAGRQIPVQIKVDTGMHRYGLAPDDVAAFVESVSAIPTLAVQGIWSHFAVAEDVLNPYTTRQFECFSGVLAGLGPAGSGLIRHLANSAGLMTFPEAHFDMVRTGIAVYGIHPSPDLADRVDLQPALSLKSRVGFTKVLARGDSLSYGQRYVMAEDGMVATIPCGYADGVRRGLTNTGAVLIGGRRFGIAGAVTMDHIMVDTGSVPVARGDEVVILGRQGAEEITAHEIAAELSTIPYEVVCGIGARVPRVYTDTG